MKAVVLAAGEGTRLRPFTETMPKVMLPVANKPMVEYVVDALAQSGVEEIILVVGYKREALQEHFKDYTKVPLSFVTQEKQLGTAHALLQAKDFVSDSFIVLAGDNIIDQKSISTLLSEKTPYAVLIKEHPEPSKYGVVSLKEKKLKDLVEKPEDPQARFISTGIYKFPNSVFSVIESLAQEGTYSLAAVIQQLLMQETAVQAIQAHMWKDIIYPWDVLSVNETMMQNTTATKAGAVEAGVHLKGPVAIGKDTHIYSGCYIVGPVIIGEGCEIGPNACIFPSTAIGSNSVIYPFSEIRNSVIMDGVHIGSNSFLSHSIIGKGTTLGHGFSTIEGDTQIHIGKECSMVNHIGAMIGEDCRIGSKLVVDPGVIIGRGCQIAPLKHIQKSIPSMSHVM